MMRQWESWVAASWVIIVLSPFWLGTEQRWGRKLLGNRDMGFGWYFANSAKFGNDSEPSQVPEAFILVSRIWILACRDSVKSFDMVNERGFWSSQLKLTVQYSSVGCLGFLQSLPARLCFQPVVWCLLVHPQKTCQDTLSSSLGVFNVFL